jgi:colanic acid/amylovoran biosynthesis glycosyltransferase
MEPGRRATSRVGYLVSQYPALSCAFIEREIAALREVGVAVDTFSVRVADPGDLRSAHTRAEAGRTVAIQGLGMRAPGRSHVHRLAASPRAYLATAAESLAAGRGVRGLAKRLMYFGEAVPLAELLRERDLRHLHVHFANNGADIGELAAHLGERVDGVGSWSWSMSMHGPTEFEDPVRYRLAAKVASARFVACISDFCRNQLLAVAPDTDPAHLPIVHMGVDTDRFTASAAARHDRVSAAGPGQPLRVLFVGRLVAEKAPLDLVDAVALLGGAQPVEVRIVGNGPLRAGIDARIAEHGLGDRIRCLGGLGQDELPGQYLWADVFCLPSHDEGVPVVLMEAMATELPVLTTRITGIPELVLDGENGMLVEPGDLDALAAGLRLLADSAGRRAELGRHGRATVLREYRSSVNAALLAHLFAGHAAEPDPGPDPGPDDRSAEGAVEVRDEVGGVLDADREPDQIVGNLEF